MKQIFQTMALILLALLSAACSMGEKQKENLSVTEGMINWRTCAVDSLAIDTLGTDSNQVVIRVPQLRLSRKNPFDVVINGIDMYRQAPDSMILVDSLALAHPELADSIRNDYSAMDKLKYVYEESATNSLELVIDLVLLVLALILIVIAGRTVWNVFIKSPFED